jgi:hypothetical protein
MCIKIQDFSVTLELSIMYFLSQFLPEFYNLVYIKAEDPLPKCCGMEIFQFFWIYSQKWDC